MFDWITFFEQRNIEYQPSRRGWVDIWCPWCGGYGTHHLGVDTKIGGYHCWHGNTHRGFSPARLVQALLGCSSAEAARIVGKDASATFVKSDDTFATDSLRRLGIVSDSPPQQSDKLSFLPEFVPIKDAGLCRPLVLPYLQQRGYDRGAAVQLAKRYGLRFAPNGKFSYRIIVPIYIDGVLVNWTGRTIAMSDELRYKSLSTDPEKAAEQGLPTALKNIKHTFLDLDSIRQGGKLLVLTEGPFDALRVGILGESYGIRSTCLFGKEVSANLIDVLAPMLSRDDEVVALFDRDASFDAFLRFPEEMQIKSLNLPRGVKDPAELTERQFYELLVSGIS